MAIHVVDFYETLSVLVRIVQDDENRPRLDPGWGFPPGYEYLWVDPATRKPIKCSGPDYIDSVLNWVEGGGERREALSCNALQHDRFLPA